jgi:hypothetical protein
VLFIFSYLLSISRFGVLVNYSGLLSAGAACYGSCWRCCCSCRHCSGTSVVGAGLCTTIEPQPHCQPRCLVPECVVVMQLTYCAAFTTCSQYHVVTALNARSRSSHRTHCLRCSPCCLCHCSHCISFIYSLHPLTPSSSRTQFPT